MPPSLCCLPQRGTRVRTMSGRRLLMVLCLAAVSWGQDQDWDWKCDPVKVQQRVNMNKIVGRWYLAATNIPEVTDTNICIGAEFLRMDRSSNLILQNYVGYPDGFHAVGNNTVTVIAPSKWHSDLFPMAAVDIPRDGNSLAITVCTNRTAEHNRKLLENTIILSRTKTLTLEPINARLREAGVQRLSMQKLFNLAGCPNDYL